MDGTGNIMFEVFRDSARDGRCRVVYFTELDEHARDAAIESAMAGEHVFGGFLDGTAVDAAKAVLSAFTDQADGGAAAGDRLERLLAPFLVR
jgi:hypothetical protein